MNGNEQQTLRALAVDTAVRPHVHDLDKLADEIARRYFPDVSRPAIEWGRKISRRKRRSIRLGSYSHHEELIRIHPLLDSPAVPTFFVQSVIYHEYLHHVLGPHHNRRFHRHEMLFPFHRESKEWLARNLGMLLGHDRGPRRAPLRRVRIEIAPPPRQLALF